MDYASSPKKLETNKLPTNEDVIRACIFEKEKWMLNNKTEKQPKISVISKFVANQVHQIYKKSMIKNFDEDKIKSQVTKAYKSRLNLLKVPRSKRCTETFLKKLKLFRSYIHEIFTVTSGKNIMKNKSRVLNKEKSKSKIVDDDIQANCKRSAALISRQKTYAIAMNEEDMPLSYGEINEQQDDADFELPLSKPYSLRTKSFDLGEIVEIQSRFGASGRLASAFVNATLRGAGMQPCVDKSKLERAKKRHFAEIENTPIDFGGGLYYDSRKDLSIIRKTKRINRKLRFYRNMRRVEHFSLVSEPEGIFLGFVKSNDGSAKSSSETIISSLKTKQIFNGLMVLGSDGTNVNVGSDNSINQRMESELKRKLHWFVCLLHANEIPLKTLIKKLDGETSGANSFSGPIGKTLENVGEMPILAFKRFSHVERLQPIPDNVFKKLSNDQKYLYRIVNALISGYFPVGLADMKIGALNHSRWVTTASRICRLYASTKFPSETLIILATYIVEVYAPTWFQIKKNELAINGPENLFFLIKKSNLIKNEEAKLIVQKCIKRNSFFAHSENVLLAQLSSDKKSFRSDAVNKILLVRERIPDGRIRKFRVPIINFTAKCWTEMATKDSEMFEPPFTVNMNEVELLGLIEKPLEVPRFKCHTQMVERAVKEVTRVSYKVIDLEQRNAMVKATLINRAKFPKFDSLKDHFIVENHESVSFLPKI